MAYGGLGGAFKDEPLADWLGQYNNTEQSYATAVDNFVLSCAGYCVATCTLALVGGGFLAMLWCMCV